MTLCRLKGTRLQRPRGCPDDVYNCFLKCWDASYKTRPTFSHVILQLDQALQSQTDTIRDIGALIVAGVERRSSFRTRGSIKKGGDLNGASIAKHNGAEGGGGCCTVQ